jgi:heme exporter protein A
VTTPLFETRGLYKRYGRQVVLRDVTMQIIGGESIALLGANGAGKSTLLRILTTLSRPSRGEVLAFGEDAWSIRDAVRERIGFVGHQPYIYPELSCYENLRFFATMFGLLADQVVPQALDVVGLIDRRDAAASTLSRGLLQRLNLARAIMHKPDALILDEPDTGLDRAGRAVLETLVAAQVDRGAAVVLTTHSFEYGLSLASRVVGLREGSVSIDRPSETLTVEDLDLYIASDGSRLAADV